MVITCVVNQDSRKGIATSARLNGRRREKHVRERFMACVVLRFTAHTVLTTIKYVLYVDEPSRSCVQSLKFVWVSGWVHMDLQ